MIPWNIVHDSQHVISRDITVLQDLIFLTNVLDSVSLKQTTVANSLKVTLVISRQMTWSIVSVSWHWLGTHIKSIHFQPLMGKT